MMMMEDDEDAEEELLMQNCSYHTKDLLLINRAQEFQLEGSTSHQKSSHKAHDHKLDFIPRRPKITPEELVCTGTKNISCYEGSPLVCFL